MGDGQYLRELLGPLGVYELRPESFSGGEVESLADALDTFDQAAQQNQRETIVELAQDMGLARWEQLLPYRASSQTAQARRAAISGFLSISGDSFTKEALRRCLAACGVTAEVEETAQTGVVAVRFPEVMGQPEGYDRICEIIESILPCHLQVDYRLKFCTWGESARLIWRQVQALNWGQWEIYRA